MISKIISFYLAAVTFFVSLLSSVDIMAQQTNTIVLKKLQSEYHKDVLGIHKGGLLQGEKAMKEYVVLINNNDALISYTPEYNVEVMNFLEYEIGTTKTKNNKEISQIIIWNKLRDVKTRLLEVAYIKTSSKEIPIELEEARKLWMKLCNEHNAKKLVETLYTDDAIYYNRGRVLRGHDQLTQEYSYMNSPSYSLQLTPKHLKRVSDDMIYEIGQCSGSYPLPYILVWKKQSDGQWKIYMDSNY